MPAPAQPPAQPPAHPSARLAKKALREEILAARRQRPRVESAVAGLAIAEQAMSWGPVRGADVVAAYVSVGREPGTGPLIEALHAAGTRVLLPVLRSDFDLDWGLFTGDLVAASRGLLEPSGARLGVSALVEADVVLAPGLAVSSDGDRLGQGGGCYDRALARVPEGIPVAVVLHDDEVGLAIPTERHDRRVTHVVTPAGVSDCGG